MRRVNLLKLLYRYRTEWKPVGSEFRAKQDLLKSSLQVTLFQTQKLTHAKSLLS
jgi:hypothetical protein